MRLSIPLNFYDDAMAHRIVTDFHRLLREGFLFSMPSSFKAFRAKRIHRDRHGKEGIIIYFNITDEANE
ncbi:hypothetical protein ATY81_00950 [Rhizobium sp. R72]|nr:hypothetical protein ATY81_00950 [Rhizobium sp. R72]OWW05646.1 hypothetical protein ATY80_00950 [Rhizobium sp. R711]